MSSRKRAAILAVAAAGIILAALIGGRTGEHRAGTSPVSGTASNPPGNFYMGTSETVSAPGQSSILAGLGALLKGNPGIEDFYRPFEATMTGYEIEKTTDLTSVERRPYSTEEGRKRALERAEKNARYLREALSEAEKRLSGNGGSRGEYETRQAREAIEEMKNGIALCDEQARRIREEDFD